MIHEDDVFSIRIIGQFQPLILEDFHENQKHADFGLYCNLYGI